MELSWKLSHTSFLDTIVPLPTFESTSKFNIYTVCTLTSKTVMQFLEKFAAHSNFNCLPREHEPGDFNNNIYGHFCARCCTSDHYFCHWNCLLHKTQKVTWQWAHVNWVWGLQAAKVFCFMPVPRVFLTWTMHRHFKVRLHWNMCFVKLLEGCFHFPLLNLIWRHVYMWQWKGIVVICNHFHEQASYQYPVFTGQSLLPGRTLGIMQILAEHHQTKPRGLFHGRKIKSHQNRVVIFHQCTCMSITIRLIK